MMCHRCLKLMRDDDGEAVSISAPSGAGTTVYVHRRPCTAAPQQTGPERRRR